MEENYKVNLTFIDEETFLRFWQKCQPLIEECNVTIALNDKARNNLMEDLNEVNNA